MGAESPTEVTIIGLGGMGSALAESLLKHSYKISVCNRSAEKADSLVSSGAVFVADVAAALAASPTTIFCVSDHQTSMRILAADGAASASHGRDLVQLSTMTSVESLELGDWAKRAGANYLDGQILSYADDIREGRGNIVCSGQKQLFDKLKPLLTDMAGNTYHVGERTGAAPAFDKAHLAWALGNYLVFLQAAAMCEHSGVDLRMWCDYNLRHLKGGAVNREIRILADQICSRSYDKGLDATMDVWKNAIDKTIEESDSIGFKNSHLGRLSELTNNAIDSGKGGKEIGILFELIKQEIQ